MSSSIMHPVPASAGKYTGRIVTVATLVIGFFGAAAPVVLNMDVSSTAGIVAGLVALSAIVVKYLDGWQKYEARLDAIAAGGFDAPALSPAIVAEPAGSPSAGGAEAIDDEEPPAPLPGELADPLDLVPADDVADIPDPPSEEEIAAAAAELDGLPGAFDPAPNGPAEELPAR